MEYNTKYLIECDIDLSSLRHLTPYKAIASFKSYSKDAIDAYNELTTISLILIEQFKIFESDLMNKTVLDYEKVPQKVALVKIIKCVSHLLLEMTIALANTNKTLVVHSIIRQIIEYFVAYSIISESSVETAVLYLNHPHVLEYYSKRDMKTFNFDDDFKNVFNMSINLFSSHHKLSINEAKKIYKEQNGWAFGFLRDSKGMPLKRFSQFKLRNTVLGDEFGKANEIVNKIVKNINMCLHPTSAYLYFFDESDKGKSQLRVGGIGFALSLTKILIRGFTNGLKKDTYHYYNLNLMISRISKFDHKLLLDDMSFESNYNRINKWRRKYYTNPAESIRKMMRTKQIGIKTKITLIDYQKHQISNKSDTQNKIIDTLDQLYTLYDTVYENCINFVLEIHKPDTRIVNFIKCYWVVTNLLHNLVVSYSNGQLAYFQKVFRLLTEYISVAVSLSKSTEETNILFFKHGIVLASQIYPKDELSIKDVTTTLKEMKKILSINQDIEGNLNEFFGWTLSLTKKSILSVKSISDFVDEQIEIVDPDTGSFRTIWKECNTTMHAGLFSMENTNDIYFDDDVMFDYINIISSSMANMNLAYRDITNDYEDTLLTQSIALVHVVASDNIKRFNESVGLTKKKINNGQSK